MKKGARCSFIVISAFVRNTVRVIACSKGSDTNIERSGKAGIHVGHTQLLEEMH